MDKHSYIRQYNPVLPRQDQRAHAPPQGKIALYSAYLLHAIFRLPPTTFYMDVLRYFKIGFAQMHPVGVANIVLFVVLLAGMRIPCSVGLFRAFYKVCKSGDWFKVEQRERHKDWKLIDHPSTGVKGWRFEYVFVDLMFITRW